MDNITSSSHILLPTCNGAEDVFLNVVKSIFSRSKYVNTFLDDAFKLGISGDVFQIEEEDLSMDWKQLNSEEQQIRQSKLLGFWAIKNFPSMGKQLCGVSWQAEVKSLKTYDHSKEISANEINKIIFKKLKLRVLQLNVSDSTLGKLKYFVNVPDTIAKANESKVSKTIKAFDIDDQWIEHCWKALKLGGFSLAFEQRRDLITTLNKLELLSNRENGKQKNGGNGSSSVAPKRTNLEILNYNVNGNTLNDGDSSIGSTLIQATKRACVGILDDNVNDGCSAGNNGDSNSSDFVNANYQPVSSAPRRNANARCSNDDSGIDFEAAILILRNDIGRLTDMFQSTIQTRESEITTGQERLHVIVIRQKDEEIAKLRATVQELRQVNDGLIKDQLNSIEQMEKQTALMNILQKGAEANFKLHEQSDRMLMGSLNCIETMKLQISDAATTKQRLEDELNVSNQTTVKLRDEINTLKEQTGGITTELKAQIETLDANLTAVEKMNSDTIDQKVKLQKELDALKRYTVSKEKELENVHEALSDSTTTKQIIEDELSVSNQTKDKLRDEINTLKEQTGMITTELKAQIETLDANLTAVEKMNSDTIDQKVKLQKELDALKRYTVSKEKELENVHEALSDSTTTKQIIEDELSVSNQTKDKLRDEINTLKEQTGMITTELKAQIETLDANLTAVEKMNSDTIDQKVKLQKELDALKRYTVSKEKELENVHEALSDATITKQRIEDELSVSNQTKDKLRDEVNALKEQTGDLMTTLKAQIEILDANLTAAEQMNSDTIDQNVKLQEELDELKHYSVRKEKELENVHKALADAATKKLRMEDDLSTSNKTRDQLRNEVNTLREHTGGVSIELKAQIAALDSNLTAAEKINSDTIDQKVKFQELDELERYTVSKEEELENVHKSFSELHKQIDLLENRKKSDIGTQAATCNEETGGGGRVSSRRLRPKRRHTQKSEDYRQALKRIKCPRLKTIMASTEVGCFGAGKQLPEFESFSKADQTIVEKNLPPMKMDEVVPEIKKRKIDVNYNVDASADIADQNKTVKNRCPKYIAPTVTNSIVMKEENLEPNVQRDRPPLYKMEFTVIGKLNRAKDEVKTTIEKLGGKLVSSIHKKIAAVISTEAEVVKMNVKMSKAKSLGIQVVPLQFLEEVKTGNAIKYIKSQSICDWGLDPYTRISEKETRAKSKSAKSVPKSVTLKLKNGEAVDPESGLEDMSHIFVQGKIKWFAILNKIDIQTDKNSYYKIQLLELDNQKKYYIFRSWGGIGTAIGSKKTETFLSSNEAVESFKQIYLERTGNHFGANTFNKIPGRYYPMDMYQAGDDIEKNTTDQNKHKSELLPAVQELVKLLFDLDTMKKVMMEFGLDMEKMPLGKLSRKELYEALKILQNLYDLIKKCGTNADFIGYSNQFYTLLPHDFGIERASIIDTIDTVNVKTEMIESLMELEVTYSFLQTETDDNKSPLDGYYAQLNTDLKPIAKDTEEYALLENYVRNTHAETHANFELEIEGIFSVERHGEQRRYESFKKLHNRKLLWHGSRLTNYVGILSHGLKIAPPEAPPTGYMFGKGVYFTDMVSESANYCRTSKAKNTGLVLLCEVALGDMYELTTADYITDLPKGKHSTKGCGKTFPNPDESHVDRDSVEIPCGKQITDTKLESSLLYNEYIVYDVAQVNVKYLFKLNINHY